MFRGGAIDPEFSGAFFFEFSEIGILLRSTMLGSVSVLSGKHDVQCSGQGKGMQHPPGGWHDVELRWFWLFR